MGIKYKSTRGQQKGLSFEEVVLGGLAVDRGLFVPEEIPKLSVEQIEEVRSSTIHFYIYLSFINTFMIQLVEKFIIY